MMDNILAFDFGGTFIKWGIINTTNKKMLTQGEFQTIHDSFEAFMQPVYCIVQNNIDNISAIAISSPGSVNGETGIVGGVSAIKHIHGPNFIQIFKEKFGLTASIENDANCALLGEVFNGKAKDNVNVNLIIIGTGIGGASLINSNLYNGNKNYGVEFGLTLQVFRNKLTRLSTSCGMYNITKELSHRYNKNLNGFDIMKMYENNDSYIIDYMNDVFFQLAVSCYNLQQIYNPQLILIGGGISKNSRVIQKINEYCKSLYEDEAKEGILPNVVACELGNTANLYGACYSFIKKYKVSN